MTRFTLESLQNMMQQLQNIETEIRSIILSKISSIKDNPNITRITSHKPHIYTIKMLNLNNTILSPFYYDYELQKEVLISILSKCKSIKEIETKMLYIIDRKVYNPNRFHPDVVGVLEGIMEDMHDKEGTWS